MDKLSDHLSVLKNEDASLYASKISAHTRGISPQQLESLGFKPVTPNKLVELCFDTDRTLVY
jgi:hypothetical protein